MNISSEPLLLKFEKGTPEQQLLALKEMISRHIYHQLSLEPQFKKGVESLTQTALKVDGGSERLIAVSALVRLLNVFKKKKDKQGELFEKLVRTSLTDPLPDPFLLKDSDDREYIGQACGIAQKPWCKDYCARAVVLEETGEKARMAFIETLLRTDSKCISTMEALQKPLIEWNPCTESTPRSATRRLTRILESFSEVLRKIQGKLPDIEINQDTGMTLSKILEVTFKKNGSPVGHSINIVREDKKVVKEFIEALANLINDLVRASFSIAMQSETYEALNIPYYWLMDYQWEKYVNNSASMKYVAKDLEEAIRILTRQDKKDDTLVKIYSIVIGNREIAKNKLVKLSKEAGLSESARKWLSGQEESSALNKQPETISLKENEYIADLLVDAQRFRFAEDVTRKQLISEGSGLTSEQAKDLKKALNFGLGLADSIESLGNRRKLRIRGNPGISEEYSPLEHQLIDKNLKVSRCVDVIRPVVEQLDENGVPFVIRKGLVVPSNINK